MHDSRILDLVKRMLTAKVVMPDGTKVATAQGTPQGGPLSSLLSNVVLDEWDQELGRVVVSGSYVTRTTATFSYAANELDRE